jgi:small subunit ribosomal protein S16
MLKIRLQRTGRKNDAHFRVVVTPHHLKGTTTKFAEIVGSYDVKNGKMTLKEDRVKHWLSVGAQPSATVHNYLVTTKVIDAKKVRTLPKKKAVKSGDAK